LKSWQNRYKITLSELEHEPEKPIVEINVDHNIDLAKEYLGKLIFCNEDLDNYINLSKDSRIKIITKN
jgi:hypothetical protein